MFISPAFAQAAGATASGNSLTGMILQLVLIFAIFYCILYNVSKRCANGKLF